MRVEPAKVAPAREPVAMLVLPDRSRWMPESVEGAEVVGRRPDGTTELVLQRLRLEQKPDGSLRRAHDLLPISRPAMSSQRLPDRLGGGYLFVTSNNGSSLWKSSTFLGRLTPLAKLSAAPLQVVAGSDRLLVRVLNGDRVWGVDPDSGTLGAPLPLPTAPRYGSMAFVDGWRGAVFADLLGLMVTRDAGVTWKHVALSEPPRAMGVDGDLVTVTLGTSKVRLDPASGAMIEAAPALSSEGPKTSARGPWGANRPLRVAVEDGWPLLDGTAVALRGGRLGRVKLEDGDMVDSAFLPLPGEEASTCSAVRFGADVGFVCGAPGQGTSLYAYAPPSSVTAVASFDTARAVMPSQNGWLVVRGECASGARSQEGAYCILSPSGSKREISTRGDTGVERVVALSDGRVAVVVPPRGGTDGQVILLPARGGEATTSVRLQPGEEMALLRRGLWLDGMYEVEPGELGGWAEAGGVVAGLRIKLSDGSVQQGAMQDSGQIALAGSFAMAAQGDQLRESVDGGLSWRAVDAPPQLGQGKVTPGLRCGVVGCVVSFERGSWLRIGWGPAFDPADLEEAREKLTSFTDRSPAQSLRFSCELKRIDSIKDSEPATARGPMFPNGQPDPPPPAQGLPSFLGMAAPTPAAGSLALSDSASSGVAARLYGWVPKGVAAGRAGRLLVRFEDRFSPDAPVRSSALSVASWRDEQALRDAFGLGNSNLIFNSLADPDGKALVLAACQGAQCDLWLVAEGQPPTQVALPPGESFARVMTPSASAVRLDESFYVARHDGSFVEVWRLDAAAPALVARVPRAAVTSVFGPQISLVRRARSGMLGLLSRGVGVPGRSEQDLFVLPIHPTTGAVGEMIRLGPADLSSSAVRACSATDDGWLVALHPPAQPILQFPVGLFFSDVELRLRVDPGLACVDAATAQRYEGNPKVDPKKAAPKASALAPAAPKAPAKGEPGKAALPGFSLTARSGNERLVATCSP